MRKKAAIALLIFFITNAYAPTLTMSPGEADLGTMSRGETREIDLAIAVRGVSGQGGLTLNPSCGQVLSSRIFQAGSLENIEPSEYSQQPICDWIRFTKPKFAVDPSQRRSFEINGGQVQANGKVTFELTVPEDPEAAEPGYHAFQISLNPKPAEGGAFSFANWIISKGNFYFRVPGRATRNVEMTDVRAVRTGQNSAQVIVRLTNQGTVTTQLRSGQAAVVNQNNRRMGTINLDGRKLEPGESALFEANWAGNSVKAGSFGIEGTANYVTGKAYLSGNFILQDVIKERIEVRNPEQGSGDGESGKGSPTWLVVMFLVLVGILMYSFDFDPFWIVAILGFLGFTALILMTSLPAVLIPVILILSAIIYYLT